MTRGRYPKGFHQYLSRDEVCMLLRYLLQHPDSTQWQIMNETSLSKSDVSTLVPRLQSKGILTAQRIQHAKIYSYSISGTYLPPLSQDLGGDV